MLRGRISTLSPPPPAGHRRRGRYDFSVTCDEYRLTHVTADIVELATLVFFLYFGKTPRYPDIRAIFTVRECRCEVCILSSTKPRYLDIYTPPAGYLY